MCPFCGSGIYCPNNFVYFVSPEIVELIEVSRRALAEGWEKIGLKKRSPQALHSRILPPRFLANPAPFGFGLLVKFLIALAAPRAAPIPPRSENMNPPRFFGAFRFFCRFARL